MHWNLSMMMSPWASSMPLPFSHLFPHGLRVGDRRAEESVPL